MHNKHVNFMSIGFFVVVLLVIDDEIDFKQMVICKPKIVLNISRQFFAHTLTAAIINMYASFMSIGFLVAELLMSDDEN